MRLSRRYKLILMKIGWVNGWEVKFWILQSLNILERSCHSYPSPQSFGGKLPKHRPHQVVTWPLIMWDSHSLLSPDCLNLGPWILFPIFPGLWETGHYIGLSVLTFLLSLWKLLCSMQMNIFKKWSNKVVLWDLGTDIWNLHGLIIFFSGDFLTSLGISLYNPIVWYLDIQILWSIFLPLLPLWK